jgi:hypothetical protein
MKIKKASKQPQYFKVRIDVEDPDCIFSIKQKMNFMKVFKAYSENSAIKLAANYCTKYMEYYPGVEFKYSKEEVEPYVYRFNSFCTKEDL